MNLPRHPLDGQIVQVVRRDPFKRFVIVRVLKKRGDYSKGDELRFQPTWIRPD